MKNELENIDHLFKSALGSLTEAPPPEVWDVLDKRLDGEKRKRRGFGWYWVVLSVCCLLLLGSMAWMYAGSKPAGTPAQTLAANEQPVSKTQSPEVTNGAPMVSGKPEENLKVKSQKSKSISREIARNEESIEVKSQKSKAVSEELVKNEEPTEVKSQKSKTVDEQIIRNEEPATINKTTPIQENRSRSAEYVVSTSSHHNIVVSQSEPTEAIADNHYPDPISEPEIDEDQVAFGGQPANEPMYVSASRSVVMPTKHKHPEVVRHIKTQPVTAAVNNARPVVAKHNVSTAAIATTTNSSQPVALKQKAKKHKAAHVPESNGFAAATDVHINTKATETKPPVAEKKAARNVAVNSKTNNKQAIADSKKSSALPAPISIDKPLASTVAKNRHKAATAKKITAPKDIQSPSVSTVEKSGDVPAANHVSKADNSVAATKNNVVPDPATASAAQVNNTTTVKEHKSKKQVAKKENINPATTVTTNTSVITAADNAVVVKKNKVKNQVAVNDDKVVAAKPATGVAKANKPVKHTTKKEKAVPATGVALKTKAPVGAQIAKDSKVVATKAHKTKKTVDVNEATAAAAPSMAEPVIAKKSKKTVVKKESIAKEEKAMASATTAKEKPVAGKTTGKKVAAKKNNNSNKSAPVSIPQPAAIAATTATPTPAAKPQPAKPEPAVVAAAKPETKAPVAPKKDSAVAPKADTAKSLAGNDSSAKKSFKKYSIEAGVKVGYEGGFNSNAARKTVVSPFIECKLVPKFSVMVQPGIKTSFVNGSTLGGQSFYKQFNDSSITFINSVPVYITDSSGHIIDSLHGRNYSYRQTHDSISKSYVISGHYQEYDLPLLLKYALTPKLSVYGGVNMTYSRFVPITENTSHVNIVVTKNATTVTSFGAPAPSVPSVTSIITYSGSSINNYNGPLYPRPSGGSLRFGYMLGFSYEFKKRWLADVLIQQGSAKSNTIGGVNVNEALSGIYYRFTIGYKLKK